MTEHDLHQFMAQSKLAVLSTTGDDGRPQSALVGVAVTPKLEFIFDTLKSSRKYPNLIARPACSFVIGWEGAQTVQYEGEAEELRPPDLEICQEAYFKVWTEGTSRLNWPGIVYFRIRPHWVRFSDFGENPPNIVTFRFPPSQFN